MLDQFRGYAIFGMIAVNFLGHFNVMPWLLKHHYGYSYADTIAPVFVFVVGIGFRLSLTKRIETVGAARARVTALRRYLILMALGAVYGGFDFRENVWDALMDIGCAGILALPFIDKGAAVRVGAAAAYLLAYQGLFTFSGYGAWLLGNSIDGGPLGPLSWVFILLLGTLVHDWLALADARRMLVRCVAWGVGLCALGWVMRMPWPGIKGEWPFTQTGMTIPYTLYSTGLAFLAFLAFYTVCEMLHWCLPHLSVLGRNPLVLYLLQAVLNAIGTHVLPANASVFTALGGFVVVYLMCYGVGLWLHRTGRIIKV